MNRRRLFTTTAVWRSWFGLAWPAADTLAQTAKDLAGTWTLVSTVTERGGNTTDTCGPHPKGILTVDANSRSVLVLARADLPQMASKNRTTATPEEDKAIAGGSLAHVDPVSVHAADKTLTFTIETATFPTGDGTEQTRAFAVSGDELTDTVAAASGGGTATVVWKRAK